MYNHMMSSKVGIIYKITSPSGKVYIGQTTQDFSLRKRQHINASKNSKSTSYNLPICRAIREYGDNLVWKILYYNVPPEKLDILEIGVITRYNSNNKNFGYNCTIGGSGSGYALRAYPPISEETRLKRSINNARYWSGKTHTEEYKNKMSERLKGNKNGFFGKHHSEKTKQTIREANSGKQCGRESPRATTYILKSETEEIMCISRCELEVICKDKKISFSSLVKYHKCKNYTLVKIK